MVANAAMLQRSDVIQYVGQNAYRFNLDPAAVLAVANHEGLGKEPVNGTAPTWILPNEGGLSNFGPPSWFAGGAGADIVAQQGGLQAAANWSWTPEGLDYWLNKIATGRPSAAGYTGLAAIDRIVNGFEHPRQDLAAGEINNAWHDYAMFQEAIGGVPVGNPIVTVPGEPGVITIPGQTGPGQLPIPTNPTAPGKPSTTVAPKFSLHLFDSPFGPFNFTLPWDFSGILLFLAALLAIIIGALMWDKSRTVIVNGASTAAMFA